MKNPINILLLFVLLAACTSVPAGKGISYSDFPKTVKLEGQVILLDTAVFRYPFRIRIQGGRAVVLDLHGTDHFFQIFTYPDGNYLTSYGKRGDSSVDMLSAENFRWNGHKLWMLDANKSELTWVVFSESGDSLLRKEAVTLDKEILRALDFVQYDDSTFIIPDYSGNNRFCFFNRKGELLRKFGNIPTAKEEALERSRPALAQAWRSFIDYNPKNGVLATATQLGEVLEIYNLKDSTQVVRIGPHNEPEFKVSQGYGIPVGIMGFSDIQVTDQAIYTVFHGRTFRELSQQPRGKEIDGGQYIYVFSLKGEPLMRYVLDRYIYGISVDEERGVITATDVNSDEPIVEFKM